MKFANPLLIVWLSFVSLSAQEEAPLRALLETGRCDKFVEALRQSAGDSLSAHFFLYSGVCMIQQSDYQAALGYLDQAVRKDHYLAEAYLLKAEVLSTLKQYPEALIQYDNALYLQPNDPDFLISKGQSLLHAGRYPEAIASIGQAIALPSCPERAYLLLGRAYQENKQMDLAFSAYNSALGVLEPQSAAYRESLFRLGVAHYLNGQYSDSERCFQILLERNPNDYQATAKLIQTHYARKEYEKANALKMSLYSAFHRGLLPEEMVREGFCFDQFLWNGKRIYAYERFQEPPGYYVKHLFKATDEQNRLLTIIQTEHTPSAALKGKKYVMGKVEGEVRTRYDKVAFDDNFNYEAMKKAVVRILKDKSKPRE